MRTSDPHPIDCGPRIPGLRRDPLGEGRANGLAEILRVDIAREPASSGDRWILPLLAEMHEGCLWPGPMDPLMPTEWLALSEHLLGHALVAVVRAAAASNVDLEVAARQAMRDRAHHHPRSAASGTPPG